MALECFIYADNPIADIAAGAAVNFLVVFANNRADADALIAQKTKETMMTAYPQVGGTVQKFEYLDTSFNKIKKLPNFDALNKGPGAPTNYPNIAFEFQVTAHA